MFQLWRKKFNFLQRHVIPRLDEIQLLYGRQFSWTLPPSPILHWEFQVVRFTYLLCELPLWTMEDEKESTLNKTLKKLEEQIKCSVCKNLYSQPRTLSTCPHIFCHSCLDGFPVNSQNEISCPICHQTTRLPDNGVSGLMPALLISNLLELFKELKKAQQNCSGNCHKDHATRCCKKCFMLLCQSCVIEQNGCWPDSSFVDHNVLDVQDVLTAASFMMSRLSLIEPFTSTADESNCK